jgi:TRAP-type C4-dicarboxylate transport system substrate-binding protein
MKCAKILCAIAVCLLVTAGVAFAGGSGDSSAPENKTYTLKMSCSIAETTPMVKGFKIWGENVAKKTNNGLTIQVYPSSQLGGDEDVIEQALQGVNVAVNTDGGRLSNYVKDIGIVGMAYIADSYAELRKITETSVFKKWEDQLVGEGIRVLSFNWYDGARHFLTNTPIETPADLKGIRIRTPGAPVWARSVAALGATPVALPWAESYNAVQSKAVDGVEAQHSASFPLRLYEVVKYINKTAHFQLGNGVIVGEKWFSQLPAEYQKILSDECKAAAYDNAALIESLADDTEKQMVEKGMTVVNSNQAVFRQAAEAAYKELGFETLRDQIWKEIGKN